MSRRVFVAGCGYLGAIVARRLVGDGWEVFGGVHSPETATALAGEPFRALTCDITDAASVAELASLGTWDAIIHCASSGRGGAEQYGPIYLEGSRRLIEILRPGYFLFTSSTSVYAQIDGNWVTEESATQPDRETGRILLAAEGLAVAHGGAVARLAGIYGPGRSVLLRKFFAGEAVIEGDGSRWINQIHRDDAAAALAALVQTGGRGVFNVADDAPIAQRDLYETLAARFRRPLPPTGPIDPNRKRGWTHKRVSNAKLRALGWAPQFPSFFDALDQDPALIPSNRSPGEAEN
jgi:nucleoside-diphosphate-sugar epimerase